VFLTAPGVQVFDAATGTALATEFNDELMQKTKAHPGRYATLATVAPQDPRHAVKELQRSISLGMKGAVINSHTQGEYLDEPKYWEIFEAAQALDVPLYLHPQTPPASMIAPFLPRGLDGAIYGFAVETGLHLLRIIVAGVFDRFPKLKIVVGHLGEGLPFWLFRLSLLEEQRLGDDQRHAVGAGDPLLPAGARRGAGALCHGLPVPVRAGRGEGHRRAADQRRGQAQALPAQCRERLQALEGILTPFYGKGS